MHALLKVIFDADFIQAQKEGVVIQCVDGVFRRIFPRIFTYSADYPEKSNTLLLQYKHTLTFFNLRILLASIRSLSTYPCPRCLIKKTNAHRLGTIDSEVTAQENQREDSYEQQMKIMEARQDIYMHGRGVKSAPVEQKLASKSLVPTVECSDYLLQITVTC